MGDAPRRPLDNTPVLFITRSLLKASPRRLEPAAAPRKGYMVDAVTRRPIFSWCSRRFFCGGGSQN